MKNTSSVSRASLQAGTRHSLFRCSIGFDMEDRTYTQKELYQFVTEYSREATEEGFDMSVGDFVDWVASREEGENAHRDPLDPWKCFYCGGFNSSELEVCGVCT